MKNSDEYQRLLDDRNDYSIAYEQALKDLEELIAWSSTCLKNLQESVRAVKKYEQTHDKKPDKKTS